MKVCIKALGITQVVTDNEYVERRQEFLGGNKSYSGTMGIVRKW